MNKRNISRETLISIILGCVGFVTMLGTIIFLLLSKGILGYIEYEYTGLLALTIICGLCIASIVLVIVSLFKGKRIRIAADIVGSISIVVAITLTSIMSVGANISGINPNLNFYSSGDTYISSSNNLKVAVASDSHWGSKKANPEARNQIMDTIQNGSYDLMVHGGDVVDLGFVRSHYVEAVKDMQAHMPTQKVHFVMGNHDALVNSERSFRNVFQPGETSASHVLNLAPKVHWVIFNMIWDEIEVKDSDLKWLDETLSQFPSDHCVVVESHGYYYASGSKSGYGEWYDRPKTIERVASIFEKRNVDLVVSGHVHSMELMKAGNVNYALVGPFGGSRFSKFDVKTKADSKYINGTDYGFAEFDIKDTGTIDITFKDQVGTGLYSESINY